METIAIYFTKSSDSPLLNTIYLHTKFQFRCSLKNLKKIIIRRRRNRIIAIYLPTFVWGDTIKFTVTERWQFKLKDNITTQRHFSWMCRDYCKMKALSNSNWNWLDTRSKEMFGSASSNIFFDHSIFNKKKQDLPLSENFGILISNALSVATTGTLMFVLSFKFQYSRDPVWIV